MNIYMMADLKINFSFFSYVDREKVELMVAQETDSEREYNHMISPHPSPNLSSLPTTSSSSSSASSSSDLSTASPSGVSSPFSDQRVGSTLSVPSPSARPSMTTPHNLMHPPVLDMDDQTNGRGWLHLLH